MSAEKELRSLEAQAIRQACTKGLHVHSGVFDAGLDRPIRSPKALREWHDLLLFVLAYPRSASEHAAASAELQRAVGIAQHMMRSNARSHYALINSGLESAPLQSTFTLELTRWMLARWPAHTELFSVKAPLEELVELLRLLLPPVELETLDQACNDGQELIDRSFGPLRALQLRLLVDALDALPAEQRTRELLWARMQVFVKLEGAAGCGSTFSRAPHGEIHFHEPTLQRGVDLPAILDEPLGRQVRLSPAQEQSLVDTARTVLAHLHRETDPVTHTGSVELFDMGRGLRIALFHLRVAHRLPFDSYVGFMAFKNGVPLAYGGAWIFPGRSKVGINVFPAMRGGESAWFFAQLLRLYRQRFGVQRFEAENYQLGHHNPDGLKSGAYWFYYRLGFRPVGVQEQRIAAREFKKLSAGKGHQVPMKVLKLLVEHGLELAITEGPREVLDTARLTMAVQQHVVEQHAGDRQKAMRQAMARLVALPSFRDAANWSPDERTALRFWALPLDLIADLENWPAKDLQRLAAVVKDKGARSETRHQKRLKDLQPLLKAWATVAAE